MLIIGLPLLKISASLENMSEADMHKKIAEERLNKQRSDFYCHGIGSSSWSWVTLDIAYVAFCNGNNF